MHPVYALPDNAFITTADAAVLIRRTPATVRRLTRAGKFATLHRDGMPLYRKGDVVRYVVGRERVRTEVASMDQARDVVTEWQRRQPMHG